MATFIINPNSTESMTRTMTEAARCAQPTLEFTGLTSLSGPPSIQGPEDGAAAKRPLLEMIAKAKGADGIIIGCFDDTALPAAAALASCPVLGIGQAAFHYCALRQWRFGVVTTLAVSVPVIEDNICAYGLMPMCTGVRASNIQVLDLETSAEMAVKPILAEVRNAIETDGAQAVVLGCAGMLHVVKAIRAAVEVPIVDPVECAAGGINWLTPALKAR